MMEHIDMETLDVVDTLVEDKGKIDTISKLLDDLDAILTGDVIDRIRGSNLYDKLVAIASRVRYTIDSNPLLL